MKIAFEEHGTGKPVILLHAFPLNRKMWEPQIEPLTTEGFRVILPDLRGFGESHNFSDINPMEDMARDVAELMETLKIDRAVIGGLSMGGYVAFNLLRLFPEKFAGVVFCDTQPDADTQEKRESRFELIERIEKEGIQVLAEEMLPNLISRQTRENKKDLFDKIEQMFLAADPKGAIAALRAMAQRKDNSDLLPKISVPVCLIYGKEDDSVFLEAGKKMASAAANAKLNLIDNAGHFSNLEQPDKFNQALKEFVKNINF